MAKQDKIERLGKRKLKEMGQRALRRTLNWAKRLGHYKRRLSRVSTTRAVEDISLLPLMSKGDLLRSIGRRRFPRACWTKAKDLNFIGMTGGPGIEATDHPVMSVPMRPADMCRRGAIAARVLQMTGEHKGRTILLEEISHSVVHQALLRGLIQAGSPPVQLGRGFTLRHIRHTIPKLSPRQMVTYPTYALFLKELLDREGKELRLNKVVLWGGIGGSIPALRKNISRSYGARVFDLYAMQEFGVLAGECVAHKGLHGLEDMFFYEVIDPTTGEVMGDGETGELVVTELSRTAMPLIRYRTGDLTSISRGKCRCGRTHLRLNGIKGRSDQTLRSSDGETVTVSDIAEKVWANPHLTGAFRIDDREGLVIETKEHKEMSRYYLDKSGPPKVKIRFERLLPHFFHRTEYYDNERYHSLLKEQMRLEV